MIKIPCVPFQLHIGQAGENEFRSFSFDWSEWQTAYPYGTIDIVISRPDGQTYPSVTDIADTPYTWTPSSTDTAVAGNGEMEIVLRSDGVIGKTLTFPIVVNSSLTAGDVPSPSPSWYEDTLEARDEAVEASQHYPYIGANGNWFSWDVDNEAFVDTGVLAAGVVDVSGRFSPHIITFSVRKFYLIGGKVIHYTLIGKNNASSISDAYIGELPTAIRPMAAFATPCMVNSQVKTATFNSTSAYLIVSGTIPSGATVELTGTYAIA